MSHALTLPVAGPVTIASPLNRELGSSAPGAVPTRTQRTGEREIVDVVLVSATAGGPWHRWGRLRASELQRADPRFDPVLNAPAGLRTYGWAAALRLPAYRAARGPHDTNPRRRAAR